MALEIVILAAGLGKRMRSGLPKVLHPLAGRPLLAHVLDTARALNAAAGSWSSTATAPTRCVPPFRIRKIEWALQSEQLGTGHAVQQAMPHLEGNGDALVLYGDVPLVRAATLRRLLEASREGVALLTVELDDPSGYGRVLRDQAGRVARIVEHKDASPSERAMREINAGFYALSAQRLAGWLKKITNRNAQKEYYLTDIVALAVAEDVPVVAVKTQDAWEVAGVNSKRELADLERHYQRKEAERLLDDGVTLADPARIDVRGALQCGRDVSIDVNCVFEGRVTLGDGVRVGANCVLRNVAVGAETEVFAF